MALEEFQDASTSILGGGFVIASIDDCSRDRECNAVMMVVEKGMSSGGIFDDVMINMKLFQRSFEPICRSTQGAIFLSIASNDRTGFLQKRFCVFRHLSIVHA